jgi:hypothetical protein
MLFALKVENGVIEDAVCITMNTPFGHAIAGMQFLSGKKLSWLEKHPEFQIIDADDLESLEQELESETEPPLTPFDPYFVAAKDGNVAFLMVSRENGQIFGGYWLADDEDFGEILMKEFFDHNVADLDELTGQRGWTHMMVENIHDMTDFCIAAQSGTK